MRCHVMLLWRWDVMLHWHVLLLWHWDVLLRWDIMLRWDVLLRWEDVMLRWRWDVLLCWDVMLRWHVMLRCRWDVLLRWRSNSHHYQCQLKMAQISRNKCHCKRFQDKSDAFLVNSVVLLLRLECFLHQSSKQNIFHFYVRISCFKFS